MTFFPHIRAGLFAFSVSMLMTACPFTEDKFVSTDTTQPDAIVQADLTADTRQPDACSLPSDCLEYRFIRVDDLTDTTTGEDPGADIDAVILVKSGDRLIFANDAPQYSAASAVRSGNPDEAIGEPDSFLKYPDSTGVCGLYQDQATCEAGGACDPTYVSLGGLGGYLIVAVPEKIEQGDTIHVLEVGNCEFTNSSGVKGTAKEEAIKIQVSVSDDPDSGTWQVVTDTATGPLISGSVPALPDVGAN